MKIATPSSNRTRSTRTTWIVLAACAALLLPAMASAQTIVETDLQEVVIDRDSDTLQDEIRPRPKDIDVADTLLVFTNTSKHNLAVACVAYNRAGTPVGRARTAVPANGLKFMTASDLSNGADFIGRVKCLSRKHIIASAIFAGPEIVNLNVSSSRFRGGMLFQIPLVATY